MAQHWTNSATTTLNGGITSGATSLVVNTGDGALFPSTGPFRIRIDNEVIEVGSRSTDTFSSLTRGAEGTAASHSGGAAVKGVLTAGQLAMFHQTGVAELTSADFTGGLAMVQLGKLTAGAGGSTFSFTSIPSGYNALKLVIRGRTTATGPAWGAIRFNSDSGAHYDLADMFYQAGNGGHDINATTSLRVIYLNGTSAVASFPSACDILIPNYDQTTFYKSILGDTIGGDNANILTATVAGTWTDTSAITRIDTVDTYTQDSVAVLWGLT